jgi:hypothetical protein
LSCAQLPQYIWPAPGVSWTMFMRAAAFPQVSSDL